MINNEKVGQFIQLCRKNKGLTQQELAKKLHLTNKAVSKWERGLSLPDISILDPLANTLDISVAELLNGEKDSTVNEKTIDKLLTDTAESFTKIANKKYKLKIVLLSIFLILSLIVLTLSYSHSKLKDDYFAISQTLDSAIWSGVCVYEFATSSNGEVLSVIPDQDYKDALFCTGSSLSAFQTTDPVITKHFLLQQKSREMEDTLLEIYNMLCQFEYSEDGYHPKDYDTFKTVINQLYDNYQDLRNECKNIERELGYRQ